MGWSEHRAGLWGLSIFSRVCVGVGCILASLPPQRGETPHAGDPAYATAAEGSRSLVNEGFATLAGGAGTRGMVVDQRDGLRKDTSSEETVISRRPGAEPRRRASHPDTAAPGAPGH